MWRGGPLWPPAVALGLGIIALHPRAATRAPTPPNSSPAPTRDPSLGHFLFLLLLSLMRIWLINRPLQTAGSITLCKEEKIRKVRSSADEVSGVGDACIFYKQR